MLLYPWEISSLLHNQAYFPVHNSMMWGPLVGPSQSLPPSRPCMPPWCTPCPHNELRQWFVQTVRCQNYRGMVRVPTHMLHILYELPINMHATRITATTCTSGFMREEEDTADFSVPFQISWSTRNIRHKNHWRHWLLSPRWYSSEQWYSNCQI